MGSGSAFDTAPQTYEIIVAASSANGIFLSRPDFQNFTQATPPAWASGDVFTYEFSIPVNEWSNPARIYGTFDQKMNVPGVTKPKTCYYYFGGTSATLAAPTECTTGTCVEVYDSCVAGTPPTRNSLGIYNDITFAAGTFAASSPIDCRCKSFDTTTNSPRQCEPYFVTGDNTWSTNSSGGWVGNLSALNQGLSAEDGYTQVTCEGREP